MIKKLLVIILLCIGYSAEATQKDFGPYLTYSGAVGKKTERITVHIGRPDTDTKTYYVAYWKSGGVIQVAKMDTRRVVNQKKSEANCADPNISALDNFICYGKKFYKHAIYSATLSGLDSAATYNYLVSENAGGLAGYKYSTKTTITATDVKNAAGKLLVNNASLSGSFVGTTGSVAFINPLGMLTSAFYTGGTLSIITVPSNGVFSFVVPDTDANSLTCLVTSDTQDNPDRGRKYFVNMNSALNTTPRPNMIIHAGDMHDDMECLLDQHMPRFTTLSTEPFISDSGLRLPRTSLLASVPLQVSEGNHDIGYCVNYSADGIVADDAQMDLGQKKYTKEMIWFDKLLHYDFPGLKSKVTVMQNGTATSIDDLYSTYYSFDNGPVHFCMLDYDNLYKAVNIKDTGYVAKQLRWMTDDLAASNKPFKVVVQHNHSGNNDGDLSYHLPFNYKGIFTDNTDRRTKEIIDEIIAKRGVSVVVSGHVHNGTNDGASLETYAGKKYVLLDIGNAGIVYDSYYTFHFNATDKSFSWKEFGPDNTETIYGDYILNPTTTIDTKPKK